MVRWGSTAARGGATAPNRKSHAARGKHATCMHGGLVAASDGP